MYKSMCSCWNVAYYGKNEKHFYVTASKHLGITIFTGKFVKTTKKFIQLIQLVCMKARKVIQLVSMIFLFCLEKIMDLKLQLKESLFILHDNLFWIKMFAPFTWNYLIFLFCYYLFASILRQPMCNLKMLLAEAETSFE